MEKLTFEQLPEAIGELIDAVKRIEALLSKNGFSLEEDEILNIEEACQFMNLSKSAMYKKTSSGEIPFLKYGKYLRFEKKVLNEILLQYRIKSNGQIEQEAIDYVTNNSFGGNKRKALRY
jgi:excisionase family DNA binding protein